MDEAYMKAQTTRERNKALREARRAAQEAAEREDKPCTGCPVGHPEGPRGHQRQHLYAVAVLDRMQYYNFVPRDMRHSDALIADFARRLENDTE